jgi:hypothetical protein
MVTARGLSLPSGALVLVKVTPLSPAWAGSVSSGWADVAASARLHFRGRWWQSTEHPGGGGGFRRESLLRALWHSGGGRDLVRFMRSQYSFPPYRKVRVSDSAAKFAADGPKARDDLAVTSSGHRRPRCRRVALEELHCV